MTDFKIHQKSAVNLLLAGALFLLFLGLGGHAISAADGYSGMKFDAETSRKLVGINELISQQKLEQALEQLDPLLKRFDSVPKLHLLKATILSGLENDLAALDYLTAQIKQQPANIGMLAARAQFLLSNGYIESAREDFYHAYEQNFRPVDVLTVLADIEKEKGNVKKAVALTKQALDLDSNQHNLWYKKAELELKLLQISTAKQSCYNAIRLAPETIDYHKLFVEILIYLKQRSELESHLRHIYSLFPTNPWVSLRVSSLLAEKGDLQEAIEVLQKSLSVYPGDHLLMFQLATILAGQGKWSEAIDYFEAGLIQQPTSTWALVQLAKIYLRTGKANLAIEYLEKARGEGSRDLFVYETLARMYNRNNDTFEAERVILEGLEIDEKDQTLILEYANLLEKRGKVRETIKAYEEGLKNDSNSAFVLGKLGNLYRMDARYDESLEALEKAIAIDPKLTWVRAYYIEALDELEQWDRALSEIDLLLNIMPDDFWAYAKKALIQFETNRLQQAHASIRQAISLRPDAGWLKEIEGRILEALKRYDLAESAFEEALKKSPDSVYILTRLAYVQVHTDKDQALITIKKALASDDFDISTLELYLYLTRQALSYWGFEADSAEYEVFKRIIHKQYEQAGEGLADLEQEKSLHAPFLAFFLNHMKREKGNTIELLNTTDHERRTPWHYYYLGVQSIREDEFELARSYLEKGFDLFGDNPWIMIKLAYVYQQIKQHHLAVDLLNRFLRFDLSGDFTWVQLRLALNYDLAKEFFESERVYRQILEKDPNDNVALNNLAWMYLTATDKRMQKRDEALKLALKAVEIQPSSANLDTLAEAYFQKKDYNRALKAIEQALDRDRHGLDEFKKTKKKILRAMEAQAEP